MRGIRSAAARMKQKPGPKPRPTEDEDGSPFTLEDREAEVELRIRAHGMPEWARKAGSSWRRAAAGDDPLPAFHPLSWPPAELMGETDDGT